MTVAVDDAVDEYLAVGGELSFTYTFPVNTVIAPALHALVVETRLSGVLTTLVEGVDYTVTGAGNPLGGTALLDTGVFPTGAIAGVTWTLKRVNPISRVTDFQTSGDFFAVEVNIQLDLITQIIQDQKRDQDANFANNIRLADASLFNLGTMVDPITGTFLRAIAGGGFDWVTVAVTGTSVSVDETDTDATKNKLVSNLLAKDWEDWKDLMTTKGDLVAFSTTRARLAIGTEGQRLNPNPSPALGIEWGNQTPVSVQQTGAFTVVAADQGKLFDLASGSFTVTLTAAATLGNGFVVGFKNSGISVSQVYTIDANGSETIDGVATRIMDLADESLWLVCDGSNWHVLINHRSGLKWTNSGSIDLTSGSPTSVTLVSSLVDVNEIEISVEAFSTSDADTGPILRIGDAGGPEITGYTGGVTMSFAASNPQESSATGWLLVRQVNQDAATVSSFNIRLVHMGFNVWTCEATGFIDTSGVFGGLTITGVKTLSDLLDRVVLTTPDGTATIDGGTAFVRTR